MLKLQKPWDSQPQEVVGVDWSNPLTRGLKLAVIGGSAVNAVDGRQASSVVSLSESVSSEGKTWTGTTSASSVARGLVFPFDVSGALTIHAIALRAASVSDANSSRVAVIACNRNNYQANYWYFNIGNGFGLSADDDKPRFIVASGGVGTIYSGGVALSGNNPATTALANQTWHRVSATKPAGAADTSGTNNIVIAAERNGVSTYYGLNGSIALVLLWDRQLSDAEISQLSGREYELFAPRSIWVPVSTASGSEVNADLGTASAIGYDAGVNANQTIAASLGTATASGFIATVGQNTSIATSLGTAAALGYDAAIVTSTAVSAALGTAAALGYDAFVSNGSVISANLGTATALGYDATVGSSTTISASLGTAAALGYDADVSNGYGYIEIYVWRRTA